MSLRRATRETDTGNAPLDATHATRAEETSSVPSPLSGPHAEIDDPLSLPRLEPLSTCVVIPSLRLFAHNPGWSLGRGRAAQWSSP